MFFVIVPGAECGAIGAFFGPFATRVDVDSWVKEKLPAIEAASNDHGWIAWDDYAVCGPRDPEAAWQKAVGIAVEAVEGESELD
jgi:hypothetical protein